MDENPEFSRFGVLDHFFPIKNSIALFYISETYLSLEA